MDKEYGCISEDSADTMTIYIKKYEDAEGRTCWMKEGKEVWKKTFYLVGNHHRYRQEVYVESLDEWKVIKNVQDKRCDERRRVQYEKELPESTRRNAVNILRKRKGYKSILLKDVTRVVRRKLDNSLIAYVKGSAVFLTK